MDKICLITGATSGIGLATARALAAKDMTVVVVGRNREKCERTASRIRKETGNFTVDYLVGDLSSQKDIRKLCEQFKSRYQRLDILINNAGAKFVKRYVTVDGYEMTFALNHLAYFLMTNLMLDILKKSEKARIINVSSSAHKSCLGIKFDDLQGEKEFDRKQAYAQSKLANVLFTYELARRLESTSITVNALHPGVAITGFNMNNGFIRWIKHLTYHLLNGELISAKEGAKTSIYLATSPEVEGVTGKYFYNMKELRSSEASYDQDAAHRLWDVSLELTGLKDLKHY